MNALALSSFGRLASFAPLVLRVVLGFLIAAHGWQKLQNGPAMFAKGLAQLNVPAPELMAWVVTLTELLGGIALILGLLTRLVAALLIFDLIVAILLVKLKLGLIAAQGGGAGAELDLAYIAGWMALLFMGPGRLSLDHALGIERAPDERDSNRGRTAATTVP